jgi:RND family efflux transporter MFP subunit
VVKFQDVDEVEVIVDVPESVMAADLRTADIVQLSARFSAAPDVEFPVQIRKVSQRADPTTQTFRVRTVMKSPTEIRLLPGMTATVTLSYRRSSLLGSRILVPVAALFKEPSGEQVVWVIDQNQTVVRRPVKTGTVVSGQVEIAEGLQPGDRIAVAGATRLRAGMKVRDLGNALGGPSS